MSLQFFTIDTSLQILPFTSDRCSPRCSPHHRSNHSINRFSKYKYNTDLDPLHHHSFIGALYIQIFHSTVTLFIQIYSREKYSFKLRHLAPHSWFAPWISSPYIGLPFFNTISQNHITSDGIPGRGQLGESLPNTMGQYHGGYPWFCTFRAL